MTKNRDDNDNKSSELIMDEFLFKTIVSLQVTLSTISKDLEQKTDLLHDVTNNLTAITYNMKEVRDRLEKKDDNNVDFKGCVDDLGKRLQLIEVKFESDNVAMQGHVKEIKYAIQQLSDSLIEIRTEKRVKDSGSEKKFDVMDMMGKTWEAIKNVKMIFYVLLCIALLVSMLIHDHGIITEIFTLIKSLIKG